MAWNQRSLFQRPHQPAGSVFVLNPSHSHAHWVDAHPLPANPALFDGPDAEAQRASGELFLYSTTLGASGHVSWPLVGSIPVPAVHLAKYLRTQNLLWPCFCPKGSNDSDPLSCRILIWHDNVTVAVCHHKQPCCQFFLNLSSIAKTCTSKMEYAPLSSPPLRDSVPIQNWLSGSLFEGFHPIADWLTGYLGEKGTSQIEEILPGSEELFFPRYLTHTISDVDGLDINELKVLRRLAKGSGMDQTTIQHLVGRCKKCELYFLAHSKKSTGGPAPRLDLSSLVPDTSVESEPPQKKTRTAAKYTHLKPSAEVNNWCSGCEDGGRVIQCDTCPRYYCSKCVEVPTELPDNVVFYCAKCWLTNTEHIPLKNPGDHPYQGFWANGKSLGKVRYLGSQSLRGQWPIINTARMVVISIRLEGMGLIGDAADVVHRHLVPFYHEDLLQLKFVDLTFNLDDSKKRDTYGRSIRRAIADLEEYMPETIVVFITTHSTPDYGDLWVAPEGKAASPPHQVLPLLIPSGLQALIEKATGSMLALIACGAVNRGEAQDQVSTFIRNARFQYGVAFAAERFLPTSANTFLQDLVHGFFVACHRKGLPRILASHYELGIHSNILIYFHDGDIYCYKWHHPARHPYGHPIPHQCSQCLGLRPYKVRAQSYTETEVTLYCPICKATATFPVNQLERVEDGAWDAHDHSVRGVWYGEWLVFKNGRPPGPPFEGRARPKWDAKPHEGTAKEKQKVKEKGKQTDKQKKKEKGKKEKEKEKGSHRR
ncbi:hypothetical protein C8R45DRAFT_933465 [Mycena sanguinolenta]|nr:hypothetical protein C8R45DRAFT_933465 [Mycena sanguinolenta]